MASIKIDIEGPNQASISIGKTLREVLREECDSWGVEATFETDMPEVEGTVTESTL